MWCRNNRVTVHLSGFLLHVIIYHMVITTFMQAALHNNPYFPYSGFKDLDIDSFNCSVVSSSSLQKGKCSYCNTSFVCHVKIQTRNLPAWYYQYCIISIVLLCYLAALMRNWQWWTVCWRCQCMSQVSSFTNLSSYSDAQVHKTSAQCHCCSSFRSLLAMCLLYYYPLITCGSCHPTTSAPWLILSSSENCLIHVILVKLLTLVDFCVSVCALASGWLL